MKNLLLVGILHGLLCPLALMAQTVTLTFTGTAIDNPDVAGIDALNGYSVGQNVSFSFVINDNAPVGDITGTTTKYWYETRTSSALYNAIGGTGISGTFFKPDSIYYNYQSEIRAIEGDPDADRLSVTAWYTSESTVDNGITVGGNDIWIMEFTAALGSGFAWGNTADGSYDASTYLSAFAGTYSATNAWPEINYNSAAYLQAGDAGSSMRTHFNLTSVTIATTAVPEPSTYAALVGLLALGFVAVRRRRRG